MFLCGVSRIASSFLGGTQYMRRVPSGLRASYFSQFCGESVQNCKHEGSLGLFWFLIKMFLTRRTGKMGDCENGAYGWLKRVWDFPYEGLYVQGAATF